jgi:RND family efflux transporter MFP subunit
MRPVKVFLPVSILVFCLLLALPGTTIRAEENSARPLPAVKVRTAQVKTCDCLLQSQVVGTVQAVRQAAIAAKISGVIDKLPVVLGSRVNKGDLLVRIDAQEITARVLQAKAQLAQAQRNLAREEKLLRQHASTPETVKAMRDMLAIAEAGLREAKSMLAYTVIKAPFGGVITKKRANIGDLATPGMPLLNLEDPEHLQVVTAIPESKTRDIKLGKQLPVTLPAASMTVIGTVSELSLAIDPLSRTMPVKIDLPKQANQSLKTGMFARITLPETPVPTIMIPEEAIVPFGQLNKVFIVNRNKAFLRLVRTGVRQNGLVEILAGLEPGEQIVISNNRLLVNGQPLIIGQSQPASSGK